MAHHQFMAQFCDCPIKCVQNYFLQFYLLLFDTFWITGLWPSSNDNILSPFFHNLTFCHHVVTILSQFTMRRRKLYSYDKLNRAIGEYYNGTKKVIAVTELMNVCLNSVELSFQMIIDACEFVVPALYELVKNTVIFV